MLPAFAVVGLLVLPPTIRAPYRRAVGKIG